MKGHQIQHCDRFFGEAADGDNRPVEGDRGEDDVHAGAVGEPRVDDRRCGGDGAVAQRTDGLYDVIELLGRGKVPVES